jgi:hypothetical protein
MAIAKAKGVIIGGDRWQAPSQRCLALAIEAIQKRAKDRASDIAPTIKALQANGADSLHAIAAGLNRARYPYFQGHGPVVRYTGEEGDGTPTDLRRAPHARAWLSPTVWGRA